ncbi:MAG: Ig-like domain-containing protein [Gemmatimonadota bacterium]|nr:Ig-like domain-containing protein [Gemmatimonadota bacterium]
MASGDILNRCRLCGALLLAATGVLGCDDTNVVPVEVATVEVEPSAVTLLAGESRAYQATARGPDGDLLTGRFVSWSTGDVSVATVSSGGEVRAEAEGETTVQATIEGVTASADLTVLPGPEIRLDPSALGFDTRRGTSVPEQTVNVTNANENGQVAGLQMFIDYLEGGATGWLFESTLDGMAAPTTVTVRPNAAGLSEGTYTAEVEIRSTTAVNSPQHIQVTLAVGAALPRIMLEETSAEVSIPAFTPTPVTYPLIDVTNTGGGELTGLSASIQYQDGAGWLTATLDGREAPTRLRLVFSAVLLGPGEYEATVRVTAPDASNSPQQVFVTLTVTP